MQNVLLMWPKDDGMYGKNTSTIFARKLRHCILRLTCQSPGAPEEIATFNNYPNYKMENMTS
jgi:hypothetical protein